MRHLGWLALLLVLPLVTVYPGYTVLAALGVEQMDPLVRSASVLATSLGWTVLGGLLLEQTAWGLGASSWAGFLLATTVGGAGVAVVRRRLVHHPEARADLPPNSGAAVSKDELARSRTAVVLPLFLFGVAGCLTLAAVAVAGWGARHAGQPAFTQLWLKVEPVNDMPTIRLGVQNFEGRPMAYELQLSIGAVPLQVWQSLSLPAKASWEQIIPLPSSSSQPVEAVLLRPDRPGEVYRRVTLSPRAYAAPAHDDPF